MVNNQGLAEHHATVTVNAPVHQVYGLFTHFNDFPKFMSFVKEVTYYDEQRSHWVAETVGQHEWDAVNENWVEDQQIGWRSTSGLENMGKVAFQPTGANQTRVDVYIYYNPPAGVLGDVGEKLGAGSRFDNILQHDLDNFARMVNEAPPGALDPTSSNYLFHSGSAAARGKTTDRQDEKCMMIIRGVVIIRQELQVPIIQQELRIAQYWTRILSVVSMTGVQVRHKVLQILLCLQVPMFPVL